MTLENYADQFYGDDTDFDLDAALHEWPKVRVVVFEKPETQPALSKHYALVDGRPKDTGQSGNMSSGTGYVVEANCIEQFALTIEQCTSHQAISLGVPNADVSARFGSKFPITTRAKVGSSPNAITRSLDNFEFDRGPGYGLIDFDKKGIPTEASAKLERLGGVRGAIISIAPGLRYANMIERASTSSGLMNTETGEEFPGSGGVHLYIGVADATDIPRLTKTLHQLAWLNGLGWIVVSESGAVLERSIIDVAVASPERLVFEGAPIVEPPLTQDLTKRKPTLHHGEFVDSRAAVPSLNVAQQNEYEARVAAAKEAMLPHAEEKRELYLDKRASVISERTGISVEDARKQAAEVYNHKLYPGWELEFDRIGSKTVADVLAAPAQFDGATLADPLEGISYGRCKAKVMRRSDGSLFIKSFAHGGASYELLHDAVSIQSLIDQASKQDILPRYLEASGRATLNATEKVRLESEARKKAGIGVQDFKRVVKADAAEKQTRERDEKYARDTADDPRARIPAPVGDEERENYVLPIEEILAAQSGIYRPLRGVNGLLIQIDQRPPSTLLLMEEAQLREQSPEKIIPSAPSPLLVNLEGVEISSLVERFVAIERESEKGKSNVALPSNYAEALNRLPRHRAKVPTCRGVQTLPIVSSGRVIHTGRDFDPKLGLMFMVDPVLMSVLPKPDMCDLEAAQQAYDWLCGEWLYDVATDAAGKAVLIAQALTIIERHILPERPVFNLKSGKRAAGKSTALNMIGVATLGNRVMATAWDNNRDESRKTLHSLLLAGTPYVVFDNIPRGMKIASPMLEAAATSEMLSSRILGVSEMGDAPSTTIFAFNGNGITISGDLASRTLNATISVERADPENRDFRHPDVLRWTLEHRAKILRALYTILLVDRDHHTASSGTRFKVWNHLIGQPIEMLSKTKMGDVIGETEGEDEQSVGQTSVLVAFRDKFGVGVEFSAAEVRDMLDYRHGVVTGDATIFASDAEKQEAEDRRNTVETLRAHWANAIERPLDHGRPNTTAVGHWMRPLLDCPVSVDGVTIVLRSRKDAHRKTNLYKVEALKT